MKLTLRDMARHPRIMVDTDYLHGTPRIVGTRIGVPDVLNALAEYGSIQYVTRHVYSSLKKEDVLAAVAYAAEFMSEAKEEFDYLNGKFSMSKPKPKKRGGE